MKTIKCSNCGFYAIKYEIKPYFSRNYGLVCTCLNFNCLHEGEIYFKSEPWIQIKPNLKIIIHNTLDIY